MKKRKTNYEKTNCLIDCVRELQSCSSNTYSKDLFLFLYYTGLRISEALKLNMFDVLDDKINIREFIHIKGRSERLIEVSVNIETILNRLIQRTSYRISKNKETSITLSKDTPLFMSRKKTRLSRVQAYRIIKSLQANINDISITPELTRYSLFTHHIDIDKKNIDVNFLECKIIALEKQINAIRK